MKTLTALLFFIAGVVAYVIIALISFHAFDQYYTWQSQLWSVSALVILSLVVILIISSHRNHVFGIFAGSGLAAPMLVLPFTAFSMTTTESVLNADAVAYGAVSMLGPTLGVAMITTAVMSRKPRSAT